MSKENLNVNKTMPRYSQNMESKQLTIDGGLKSQYLQTSTSAL